MQLHPLHFISYTPELSLAELKATFGCSKPVALEVQSDMGDLAKQKGSEISTFYATVVITVLPPVQEDLCPSRYV